MKLRFPVVAACLVSAAALFLAASAHAALNAYRTGITLPQAVKLGDGSVLPAGKYDVEVRYRGFGNAAEFWFLQNGALKGKAKAEARGFTAVAPPGGESEVAVTGKKVKSTAPVAAVDAKGNASDKQNQGSMDFEGIKGSPAVAPQAFSWSALGFQAGGRMTTTPAGQGMLKLSLDSSNSAAGFSAILPAVAPSKK